MFFYPLLIVHTHTNLNHLALMVMSSSLGVSILIIRVLIAPWKHLRVVGGKGAHEHSSIIGLNTLLIKKRPPYVPFAQQFQSIQPSL